MLWKRLKSANRQPARNPPADETAANDGTFPVIKSGPLYWARDKQALILQRSYAVIIPQRLLLYYREEDYETHPYDPQVFLDLQTCLAVQRTDSGAKSPEFLLLLLPGGAKLFVCESLAEREQWIYQINVAMEADIQTRQMQHILQGFSNKSGINYTFFHSLSLNDSSNYTVRKPLPKRASSLEPRLIIPTSVPLTSSETLIVDSSQVPLNNPIQTAASTETHLTSPPTIAATDATVHASSENSVDHQSENAQPGKDISNPAPAEQHKTENKSPSENLETLRGTRDTDSLQVQENSGRYSETFASVCDTRESVDSGLFSAEGTESDGCSCLTNIHETDEVAEILREVHPHLFDESWKSAQKNYRGRTITSKPVNEHDEKRETLEEIKKLSMMLASQETACQILHESCAALKDTIGHLQQRMVGHENPQSASTQHWLPRNVQRSKSTELWESRLPDDKQVPATAQDLHCERKSDQDYQTAPLYSSSSESALTTTLAVSAETLHSSASTGGSETTLVSNSIPLHQHQRGDDEAPENRLQSPRTRTAQSGERYSSASSLRGEWPDILQEVTLYAGGGETPACSCSNCLIPALSIILELLLPQNATMPRTAAQLQSSCPPTTARLRSLASHLFFHAHHLLTDIRTQRTGTSDTVLTTDIVDSVLMAIGRERVTGSLPPLREDERDADSSLKGLLRSATENLCLLIFGRHREPAAEGDSAPEKGDGGGGVSSDGGHNLEPGEAAHLLQQDMKQIKMLLPAYLVTCFIIYYLSSRESSSTSNDRASSNAEDVLRQQQQYIYQTLGLESPQNIKSILDAIGSMSNEFLEQVEEEEASAAFSYELGQDGALTKGSEIACFANIEFTPLFMRLLKAASVQNPTNVAESGNSENDQNLDSEVIHDTQNDINVPTQAMDTLHSGDLKYTETVSTIDGGDRVAPKPPETSLSPSLTRSLEHLESLSVSLLQQRKSLLQRKKSKESDLIPPKSPDQDAEDYARAVAALQRQHEEEIKAIWDNVQANWVPKEEFEAFAAETEQQIHTLHQHLKRICADAQENGGGGGVLPTEDAAPGNQYQGNPSLFILLRQLEKANEAFTSLLRSETFREEFEPTGSGRPTRQMAEGMTKALAHLTSAAEYLRARLYGNDFEGIEEDEKELPSNYDGDDEINGNKGDNPHPEWEPGHPTRLPYPIILHPRRGQYLAFNEEEESEI